MNHTVCDELCLSKEAEYGTWSYLRAGVYVRLGKDTTSFWLIALRGRRIRIYLLHQFLRLLGGGSNFQFITPRKEAL